MRLHLIFIASVMDIYGPKLMEKPLLFRKLAHTETDLVKDFLASLNKSDPREIQSAVEMICNNLDNSTAFSSRICDRLLHGQSLARSYRMAGDLAYTDMKVPQSSIYVLVPVFSLEMVLSVCGNSLVIWSFTCRRQMRSVTNFFIVSLAASDLLMTLSSIPLNIAQVLSGFWQFGSTVCKLGPFTTQLSVAASSLTLCCIAFDRYLAVVHPLRLSSIQSPRRAVMLMTAVWLVALAAACPSIHYHRLLQLCEWPAERCALYCGMPHSLQWLHWLTYLLLLLLPMMLMGVSYAIIIFKLWLRQPVGSTVNVESLRMQYKRKAIKMLFTVMVIFVSCWTPVLTFDLLAKLLRLPLSQRLVTLRYYLHCLALSATCLNPMVYAFLHDKFRKNFSQLCRRCPCSSASSTSRRITPLPPPRPQPRPAAMSTHSEAECSDIHLPEKIFQVELLQQTWVEKFGPNKF